ncbi:MAG: M56 family metallopeptidase [Acidobacteria bacterium]|nr:M56 family metallopeptidase [Acidobacteriota bacterium]
MHLLLNWIWQASALVVILTLLIAPWRRLSAAMRHAIWWIALALVLALPLPGVVLPSAASLPISAASGQIGLTAGTIALPDLPWWLEVLMVVLWLEWMAFSAVRCMRAIDTWKQARALCVPFPRERERRLPLWQQHRRTGRQASLALSPRVRGAAVLGLRGPIIAISPSLAARLTDVELDQVIAHELAHVRRWDDLATVVQTAVDIVVGFHPALRAVQRRLHLEREMACDDWVVRAGGSAKRYAACLTRVASVQGSAGSLITPAALAPTQLASRVTRLLDPRRSRSRVSPAGLLAATPLLVVLTLLVGELNLISPPGRAPLRSIAAARAPGAGALPAVDHSLVVQPSAGFPVLAEQAPIERHETPAASSPGPRPTRRMHRPAAARSHQEARSVLAQPPLPGPVPLNEASPVVEPSLSVIGSRGFLFLDSYAGGARGAPRAAVSALDMPSGDTATPWGATATAGMAIGQGSQRAALVTAEFVSRMSRSVARVF